MANKNIVPPDIDDMVLEEFACLGATYDEMAKFFGTSQTWLQNNKKDLIDRGVANMKMKLRRQQLRIAMDETHKSQHVMLIFLGKAILGQREVSEVVQRSDKPSKEEFEINQIKSNAN